MILQLIKHFWNAYLLKKDVQKHINESPYKNNLYSVNWIRKHHEDLMNALPDMWTHIENIDFTMLGLRLKILNVPWDTKDDLHQILVYLESIDLIQRKNGYQIVRNPDTVFNPDNQS
jgi:hypothetical protein